MTRHFHQMPRFFAFAVQMSSFQQALFITTIAVSTFISNPSALSQTITNTLEPSIIHFFVNRGAKKVEKPRLIFQGFMGENFLLLDLLLLYLIFIS